MRLTRIVLPTRDLDATARYYRDTLGLPVDAGPTSATVTVGATTLVFEPRPYEGDQHLAFTIPTGSFAAAKRWIAGRSTLLTGDGLDEFEGSPAWNSRSVYFDGPDGQVLELIERRALDNGFGGEFGPDSILCVSEVGIAVPDVGAAVEQLRTAGATPYANPPGPQFAAVGDVHGLLILVAPGRGWMPTGDRYAASSPVTVHAHGVRATRLTADQTVLDAATS